VNDVANIMSGKADGTPVGIHFEPGVWMHIPATTGDPPLATSLVRMGSIPHGTTINAQCLEPTQTFNGPPKIPTVDITPFVIGDATKKIPFAAQTATNDDTPRLPQDLSKFIAAGTITQDVLTDPNTKLREANEGKNIIKTEVFTVNAPATAPELGGGTQNISFLVGATSGTNSGPNANAVTMSATFWINTVQSEIDVPALRPGHPALKIAAHEPHPGARVPTFVVQSQDEHVESKKVTVTHTEIQYSQQVNLNFAGLTWPHVSVATLVPTTEQHVPPHALSPSRPAPDHPVPQASRPAETRGSAVTVQAASNGQYQDIGHTEGRNGHH
jgi:hypothetical protein